MLASNRVIWKDNTTLRDLSTQLNNYFSEVVVTNFNATQDKLFIGSDVPFNHRFLSVESVNAANSVLTVDIWDGDEWVPAIDVIDYTQATSGRSLSQSGILQWSTDRNETWGQESTTENMTSSGLETLKIYNMYWARISFSGNMTSTTTLKYIGHRFSKDEDMNGYYPDLNRSTVMSAFQAGKADWDDQHIIAAEAVFNYLRNQRTAWSKGQIFEWQPYTDAAVHKVAEIIYTSFGEDYADRRDEAYNRFKEAMDNAASKGVDEDGDGHMTDEEHYSPNMGLVRR